MRQSSCSASYMLLSILFLFFCILKAGWDTKKQIEREKEREKEQKKRELHELQYTEIVKSGTIRLASGYTFHDLDITSVAH